MDAIDHVGPVVHEDRLSLSVINEDNDLGLGRPTGWCGWWMFRPSWLQRFRTPKWVLFWLCWASAMQGMVVNGFVNVVITTIEKRFGLRSSETGLVAGGYDIASFLCLVPVTYYGGRMDASKPRWLGWGVIVMAIGSFVFALPHFMVSTYRGSEHHENVCYRNTTLETEEDCVEQTSGEYLSMYLWLFVVSQLLTGAGAAPLYTLGVTYIDENVSKKMSSVYLGIYYTLSLVGPALGYLLGGELLKIYTDFLTNDPSEFGLTPNSNVWVGAWWVGFLLAGVVCVAIAVPIFAFPPSLPGSSVLQLERESEAHGNSEFEAFRKLREIPRAFKDLVVNPTFSFLNLAGASEGFLVSGFAAFLPKLIENEFSISASFAAILMGLITVPAGGGGTFLGGYLVKRLNLRCSGIIKLCIINTFISIVFISCFLLTCPNLGFAGLNVPYAFSSAVDLDANCNVDCSCTLQGYDPVCGVDGVMYYSPCHAGCEEQYYLDDYKVYNNCSCIPKLNTTTSTTPDQIVYEAQNRMCPTTCPYLWLFVVLCFLVMLFTFLATMPALSATLRCVQDEQRSFALGIQWVVVRIFGTIPAPMIFGALIDRTCILWEQTDCGGQGSCLVYDNDYMSRYMLGIAVIGKLCSLLFFFCSWWFYVPPTGALNVNNSLKHVVCNGQNGGFQTTAFDKT